MNYGRIVHAFLGQWKVEELFRRAKKGGVAPWGPSHQWADTSLRLHTFAIQPNHSRTISVLPDLSELYTDASDAQGPSGAADRR